MSHRGGETQSNQARHRAVRPKGRGRAAACPARPAGGGRPRWWRGPAARLARDRSRPARRRAHARLPARTVRRGGPGGRAGLRHGAARPADGGWRPRGLDRAAGRAVRPWPGRAGSRPGAPDRGPGAGARCPALGARGGAAQLRGRGRARRDRPAEPDREPAAAARRRGQRRERPAFAAARSRRHAERRRDALADRGGSQHDVRRGDARCARQGRARARPAALAGQPVPLPRRPYRQLAGRLAAGGLA